MGQNPRWIWTLSLRAKPNPGACPLHEVLPSTLWSTWVNPESDISRRFWFWSQDLQTLTPAHVPPSSNGAPHGLTYLNCSQVQNHKQKYQKAQLLFNWISSLNRIWCNPASLSWPQWRYPHLREQKICPWVINWITYAARLRLKISYGEKNNYD